jgi:cytochrome c-type biogenesis protein CcmE
MSAESLPNEPLELDEKGKKSPWLNPKILTAGVVLVVAVAFLIYNAMGGSAAFYMTVTELKTSTEDLQGQQIKVGGDVVHGSVVRGDIGEEIRFDVTDGVETIPMVYDGDVPDIFADNVEVIATGTMNEDGVFVATELLTKCPSRFESDEGVSG